MQLSYSIIHFDVKRRKQEVFHVSSLLHIQDFYSLFLPEEISTFAEIVLGSRSSDFDVNNIYHLFLFQPPQTEVTV